MILKYYKAAIEACIIVRVLNTFNFSTGKTTIRYFKNLIGLYFEVKYAGAFFVLCLKKIFYFYKFKSVSI